MFSYIIEQSSKSAKATDIPMIANWNTYNRNITHWGT